ncbi:MAG TPA: Uma2 family endonuclease [Polyangiaceae bacterium]|nr:Uma2 family endonuclease [Polyangiaceae bacterium]
MSQPVWVIDPDEPRAPPQALWDGMSPAERAKIVASLPAGMPLELHPPEGDPHRKPKERARDALDEFFRSVGRRVYVSSELVTYYPGEPRFCPDILAVLDVDSRDRTSWIVSHERKGLDLVIEIATGSSSKKDFERNVQLYARLAIPEYFIFDRPGQRVIGYRLRSQRAGYEPLVPQAGRLLSQVLGLELTAESGMLRFYHGTAPLLFMDELVGKLNHMIADLVEARDAAAQRAEQEAQRAEQEAQRASALEREVEELRATLDRLKR